MKKTFSAVLFVCTAVLAVGFTLLRCFMIRSGYDFANGFYTDGTLHTILRAGLIAVAAIFFACGYIYNIKEEKRAAKLPQNTAATVAAYLSGAALCGFVLYTLAKFVFFRRLLLADGILCIFALIGAFYYFTERQYAKTSADFRALLCAGNALALLTMIFGLYFNGTVSYVNHSVILCFAAAIFLMLTLLAEANFVLNRPAYRRYFSYAPTAVILSFTLAVPDLIAAAVNRAAVITDVYYDVLILALGLHQLTRMAAFAFAAKQTED